MGQDLEISHILFSLDYQPFVDEADKAHLGQVSGGTSETFMKEHAIGNLNDLSKAANLDVSCIY
jgi:hypothetical protein